MTSVSSRGPTPHSPYELDSVSAPDTDDSWQYLDHNSPSYADSVGFLPSPASGSLDGYAVVGNVDTSDLASLSPLNLDHTFEPPPADADRHVRPDPQDADHLILRGYLFPEDRLNDMTCSLVNSIQTNVPFTGLEVYAQQQKQQQQQQQLKVDNVSSKFVAEHIGCSSHNSVLSTTPNQSNPSSPDMKLEAQKAAVPSHGPTRRIMAGKVEKKNSLSDATKQSALQVRRLGACSCCHSRKAKCDKERPCTNCKKLVFQMPRVICWQFADFMPVLFPGFMRAHFRKERMVRFMRENVDTEAMDELAPREVELFSGLSPVLRVKARFFRPRTADVQKHYHLHVGTDRLDLQARRTAPMLLELDTAAQRDALENKVREYVASIASEPGYAQRMTESIRHTELPRQVLEVVQDYADRTDSPTVRKALAIYSAHFVMTRHLCITRSSVMGLKDSGLVPQEVPWVTPRVLNRQIKAVIDEMLMRDMQELFESFSRSLKPKSRREWAPCLAAFLVLCLFMEAVETAADTFVVALNEISLRNHTPPEHKRQDALDVNQEVENMPFKQLAYQFHQTYQTHSRDSSVKPFNPLADDAWIQPDEVDEPAAVMVMRLKELIRGDNCTELESLTMDPILPNGRGEDHPFPRDVSVNYTGRMVAKFLLSFLDEKHISGGSTG